MSRLKVRLIVALTIVSFIAVLLLSIAVNISTGYLSAISPLVESWVKGHVIWFVVAIIVLCLLAATLAGIIAYLQLTNTGNSSRFDKTLDVSGEVNDAADMATQDPMLKNYSNQFSILRRWKKLVEDLIGSYEDYTSLKDKESKYEAAQTVDLLEKLLKPTKRSFIYLNRKSDFAEIARSVYKIAFANERWKYAADLAYDAGSVYDDLGKGSTRDWIEALRTCLEKANLTHSFDRYWAKAYNELKMDDAGSLDKPADIKVQQPFYEALTYAAKLYDLEGLSKQNDQKAKEYFEKALSRAERLPDKVLYSRIKIHMAKVVRRLHIQPVDYYTDALATLDALDLATLDPLKCSDIVNLKLTCYYHLGSLALPDRESWYKKQVKLAEEYGSLDFQMLGHMQLAEIALQQGCDQTAPDPNQSLQMAYKHIKQAWDINKNFGDEGIGVVEPNKLAQLTIDIVDKLIQRLPTGISPASNASV